MSRRGDGRHLVGSGALLLGQPTTRRAQPNRPPPTARTTTRDAVLLLPGCCDPFNEKALRASRGAALRLPLVEGSWDELAPLAADGRLLLMAAEPEEEAAQAGGGGSAGGGSAATAGQGEGGGSGVCLVLGSEGQGLSATALERCRPVAIPMVGQMESLNVSVAGGE